MLDSIHHKNIPTTKQRPNGAPLAGLDWTGLDWIALLSKAVLLADASPRNGGVLE
jgi:hypothetical protein